MMPLHYKAVLILLFMCCIPDWLSSQSVFEGVVMDLTGQPISGANITTTGNKPNGLVRAYALTDEEGKYRLVVGPLSIDSLFITAAGLGYTPVTIKLSNKSQVYHFQLKTNPKLLPEVLVGPPPVFLSKDTLNYEVSGFSSPEDRVIADVLKKLPGVEVTGSGQVLYHGKPIQQLTVEGLNLLEAQYGLISQNLPSDAVSRIQVIENDQHIRILDSLIPSNLTSINLKLRKLSVTGSVELGIGGTPLLRQVNLIPMLFNKNFQMVNAFLSNNTGVDGTALMRSHDVSRIFSNTIGPAPATITGIVSSGVPPLQQERWLNNNINQWSSNFLVRMKSNWIAKAAIAYINDFQSQNVATSTIIYTPAADPVRILEDQTNNYNINKASVSFILEKNVKKLFFRNHLSAYGNWHMNNGSIFNKYHESIFQNSSIEQRAVSNRLNIKKVVGKHILNFNSIISYTLKPEQLIVAPGPFPEKLNDTTPYEAARQIAESRNLDTDHFVGFTRKLRKITAKIRLGVITGNHKLRTQTSVTANLNDPTYSERLSNELQVTKWAGYSELGLTRNFFNGYLSLDLPLQWMHLQARQSQLKSENRFLWQPQLYAEYRQGNKWKWYGSVARGDTILSNPASFYELPVLTNYRTLQRFEPFFMRTKSINAKVGLEYKKVLRAFWMNAEAGIERRTSNLVFNTEILPDGTSNNSVLPEKTQQSAYFAVLSFSKVFVPVSTIIRFGVQGSVRNYERILNMEPIRPVNHLLRFQADIVNSHLAFIHPSLHSEVSIYSSRSARGRPFRRFVNQKNQLDVTILPATNHQLKIRIEHMRFDQPGMKNQLFLDAWYRFVWQKKKKIDLELRCVNLLNRRLYQSLYTDGFLTLENNFWLRPRQLLLVCRMGL